MLSPLIRKLENFTALSDDDKRAIQDSTREIRQFGPREDIIREGDKPDNVHLILEGWAARYKLLPEGERPIMAFLIPGDLCDIKVTLLDQMDHSIATLSPCKVAYLPRDKLARIMEERPTLSRALWWSMLVDEAILREWLVTVGHRPANKRLAHFICEMMLRSRAVGLSHDDGFSMPLTQEELADTMGMTPVHANRMLKELRDRHLIEIGRRRMIVKDLPRLIEFADFNPNYLHQQAAGLLRQRA
jgi:CRP-like cAMP-binding protein